MTAGISCSLHASLVRTLQSLPRIMRELAVQESDSIRFMSGTGDCLSRNELGARPIADLLADPELEKEPVCAFDGYAAQGEVTLLIGSVTLAVSFASKVNLRALLQGQGHSLGDFPNIER